MPTVRAATEAVSDESLPGVCFYCCVFTDPHVGVSILSLHGWEMVVFFVGKV